MCNFRLLLQLATKTTATCRDQTKSDRIKCLNSQLVCVWSGQLSLWQAQLAAAMSFDALILTVEELFASCNASKCISASANTHIFTDTYIKTRCIQAYCLNKKKIKRNNQISINRTCEASTPAARRTEGCNNLF